MLHPHDIEQLRIDNLSITTSLLIRAAQARGLTYRLLPGRVIQLSDGQRTRYITGTMLPCNNMVAGRISNDKSLTRHLLRQNHLPVPRTLVLRTPAAWQNVLRSRLRWPLVVKPVTGSHGLGATMKITKPRELELAVQRAFAYMKKNKAGDRVLVEEFFEGTDLRFLVVGSRVVSVVKREPAYVVGDGRQTVRQLIAAFNNLWQPKRSYDIPVCPIVLDTEVTRYLQAHKRTLHDVPAKDEKVTLRWNANVSAGGRAVDVTDEVPKSLKKLAVQTARMIDLQVAGVDILCRDYTKPHIDSANVIVLEINESAGFDINQLPYEGKQRDVAGAIIDTIFPPVASPTPIIPMALQATPTPFGPAPEFFPLPADNSIGITT